MGLTLGLALGLGLGLGLGLTTLGPILGLAAEAGGALAPAGGAFSAGVLPLGAAAAALAACCF